MAQQYGYGYGYGYPQGAVGYGMQMPGYTATPAAARPQQPAYQAAAYTPKPAASVAPQPQQGERVTGWPWIRSPSFSTPSPPLSSHPSAGRVLPYAGYGHGGDRSATGSSHPAGPADPASRLLLQLPAAAIPSADAAPAGHGSVQRILPAAGSCSGAVSSENHTHCHTHCYTGQRGVR